MSKVRAYLAGFSNLLQSIFISMPVWCICLYHTRTTKHQNTTLVSCIVDWSTGNNSSSSCILSVDSTSLVQRWPIFQRLKNACQGFISFDDQSHGSWLFISSTNLEKKFIFFYGTVFFPTCNFQVLYNNFSWWTCVSNIFLCWSLHSKCLPR